MILVDLKQYECQFADVSAIVFRIFDCFLYFSILLHYTQTANNGINGC